MDTNESLAWLAGLLEGEATFTWQNSDGKYGWPVIDLSMTDEDVVKRAADAMGGKAAVWKFTRKDEPNRKPMYRCRLVGWRAAGVMAAILPFMGQRRSSRIQELLARFRERPGRNWRYASKRAIERTPCFALLAA